jgi:hypothetical protein
MSTRTIAEKLLIKPNTTLWSSHPSRLELLEPLPTGVRQVDGLEQARTALVFANDAASLRELSRRVAPLERHGMLPAHGDDPG